jgi:signal transduction histidine kinase
MSIRTNLIIALSIVFAVMVATAGYLGWSSYQIRTQIRSLTPAVEYLDSVAETRAGITHQMVKVIQSLLMGTPVPATEQEFLATSVQQSFTRWEAALRSRKVLASGTGDYDLKLFETMRERHRLWQSRAHDLQKLLQRRGKADARHIIVESGYQLQERAILEGLDQELERANDEVRTDFNLLLMSLGRLLWSNTEAMRMLDKTQSSVNSLMAISRINNGIYKQLKEVMDGHISPHPSLRPSGWAVNETRSALMDFRNSVQKLVQLGNPSGTRLLSAATTLEKDFQEFTILCQQSMALRQGVEISKPAVFAETVIGKTMNNDLLPSVKQAILIGIRDIARLNASVGWQGMAIVVGGAILVIITLVASLQGTLKTFAAIEAETMAITAGDLTHRINLPATTELGRLAASFNNMTESLQKSRNELEQLNIELEQRVSERTTQLAAANDDLRLFSFSVCHDLRTPLSAISGYSQLLLLEQEESLPLAVQTSLQRILESSREMAEIINALMKLGRISEEEIGRELVDLTLQALLVVAELRGNDPERTVETIIEDGLTAHGDERLLRLVLENLLGNAWKYTARQNDGKITFGTRMLGDETVYFISDNGAGFDMARADELFKPFSRLHSSEEFDGTGIGLATVQRIIARHGGRIWAEASPESGATFSFTLPAETTEA